MKITHIAERDFLSIDFTDELEAKSVYKDGVIVRYNQKGNVIGIDITDSLKMFANNNLMTLKEACEMTGLSESTIRRKIKNKEIVFQKKNNEYRFKKSDLIKFMSVA